MAQHQALDLAIRGSAPIPAFKKRPADLDFAFVRGQVPITRAADDASRLDVDDGKSSARIDPALEIFPKDLGLIALVVWMLLPDEWVLRCLVKRVIVVGP